MNKNSRCLGNSAGAVPYSNLCNGHEGAKNKTRHMGKKLDDVIQEEAKTLSICIENIVKARCKNLHYETRIFSICYTKKCRGTKLKYRKSLKQYRASN